jgi:hypothetical protein
MNKTTNVVVALAGGFAAGARGRDPVATGKRQTTWMNGWSVHAGVCFPSPADSALGTAYALLPPNASSWRR